MSHATRAGVAIKRERTVTVMKRIYSWIGDLSPAERALWLVSIAAIAVSYSIFDRESPLRLIASLIGVTSLILNAKGNPAGQALMVVFGSLYGIISYTFDYYGEMITYVGMTVPMAVAAFISWMRNPYHGRRSEVRVGHISTSEIPHIIIITAAITAVFYFILRALGTANLLPSTVSVTTSFLAVYLTYRRSALYALAYAANDIVLIVLWSLASVTDKKYISVLICFALFLVSDLYAFFQLVTHSAPSGCGTVTAERGRLSPPLILLSFIKCTDTVDHHEHTQHQPRQLKRILAVPLEIPAACELFNCRRCPVR